MDPHFPPSPNPARSQGLLVPSISHPYSIPRVAPGPLGGSPCLPGSQLQPVPRWPKRLLDFLDYFNSFCYPGAYRSPLLLIKSKAGSSGRGPLRLSGNRHQLTNLTLPHPPPHQPQGRGLLTLLRTGLVLSHLCSALRFQGSVFLGSHCSLSLESLPTCSSPIQIKYFH